MSSGVLGAIVLGRCPHPHAAAASLRAAIMIWAILVNTQTHLQTAFDWFYTMSSVS